MLKTEGTASIGLQSTLHQNAEAATSRNAMKGINISSIASPFSTGADLENISSNPSNFSRGSEKDEDITVAQAAGTGVDTDQPIAGPSAGPSNVAGPSDADLNLSAFSSDPIDLSSETEIRMHKILEEMDE